MQCNQLIRLMKDWYLHVKEETMAPARMLQFADKHIKNCDVCQQDSALPEEMEKIREFVLPESKIPKSERDEEDATPDISPDEDEDNDENEDEDDEDMDEDFDEEEDD